MGAEFYYFFCGHCGADTATYEKSKECPYCHTTGEKFRLIGQSSDGNHAKVASILETERQQWYQHNNMPAGEKRRRKLFKKH